MRSLWLKRAELWLVINLSPRFRRRSRLRKELAARYLSGTGIEIGALHVPLDLPKSATVRYVDRIPLDEQRVIYPELSLLPLVTVDILDDAESLQGLGDATQDFVVANHVIEHTQNPILTLQHWLRVLRPGGVLYFAVPDKRYTFDRARALTTLEHVVQDYRLGPAVSFESHWVEIATVLEGLPDHEVASRIAAALAGNESPHYHVWTAQTFRQVLDYCRSHLGFAFDIETISPIGNEFIVILRKLGPREVTGPSPADLHGASCGESTGIPRPVAEGRCP
jgi:SAM-dependent methyltransferase